MYRIQRLWMAFLGIGVVTSFVALGCGTDPGVQDSGNGGSASPVAAASHNDSHEHDSKAEADAGHNLHGWWCTEHGVPEEECARCDISLIAQFKAQGDWCEDHDRPESQCFICDPARFEKFAARYEAKTGKRPPEPAE